MKKILFILTIMAFGLASCLQENDQVGSNRPKGANDVTFKVQIPSGTVNTRAIAARGGESKVNDLTLLFFGSSKTGAGQFKGSYVVPQADLPAKDMLAFDLNIPFDSSTGLNKNEAYNILVMANMLNGTYFANETELETFLTDLSGKTESAVTKSMTLKLTGAEYNEKDNTKGFYNDHLPMTVRASKAEGTADVTIDLVRTVVRFDIVDGNKSDAYTLVSASVWNAFKTPSIWDNATTDYTKARTKRLSGSPATGQDSIVGNLYSVENVSTTPDQNDEKTTCLIIGMKYTGSGSDNGTVYYYRLNVATDTENGQYLRRNNVYHTTINNVLDKGEINEKDAYSGGKFLLDVAVNPWDRDENGLVLTDGENVLALPTRKATFGPDADEKQYYIYTSSPAGKNHTLELINLELPEGITTRLEGNNLFITVTKFTDTQRKGSIELRYAGLKGTIEIIQRGEHIKYLELSYTHVDIYPAGAAANMIPNTKPIKVTSSGPWTATIMGGDEFSFNMSYLVNELKGDDEDMISSIFSRGANPNVKAITNVVLITLDEDPENYRSVIVLTQKGTGAFTPTPALPDSIKFDADRTLSNITGNNNVFALESSDNEDSWNVKITGANAKQFRLLTYANNDATVPKDTLLVGRELGAGPTNKIKFGVIPTAINYTGKYSADLEITHNGVVKVIPIQQDVYKMTVSVSEKIFTPKGGISNLNVTVSGTTGLTMNVAMALTGPSQEAQNAGYKPKMVLGMDTLTTITNGTVGGFKVLVPRLLPPFGHLITTSASSPKITVTISIPNTPLSEVITLQQGHLTTVPTSLQYQDAFDYYGSWNYANNLDYTYTPGIWTRIMQESSSFGPTGTVYAPSSLSNAGTSTTLKNNSRLLGVLNAGSHNFASQWSEGVHIAVFGHPWPARSETSGYNVFRYFNGTIPYTWSMMEDYGSSSGYNLSTAPASTLATPLWKYLVGGEGPFGKVNPSNVNLTAADGINTYLKGYPSTMIPLMVSNGSNLLLGVDPTNRVIWVGDMEMFSPARSTNTGTDTAIFLRNLTAYMVNVALYGDVFNDLFKVPATRASLR